jgi:hypothetical protein
MQVTFKFEIDDLATTILNSKGLVSMLWVDKSGNVFYVKQGNGSGQWWEEGQLTLTSHTSN